MLTCHEEILKEKKRSLSCHSSMLGFFKPSSGTHASPPVLLDIEDDDPDDKPTVQKETPDIIKLLLVC